MDRDTQHRLSGARFSNEVGVTSKLREIRLEARDAVVRNIGLVVEDPISPGGFNEEIQDPGHHASSPVQPEERNLPHHPQRMKAPRQPPLEIGTALEPLDPFLSIVIPVALSRRSTRRAATQNLETFMQQQPAVCPTTSERSPEAIVRFLL
jgi:hypothetical protein